MTQKTHLVLDSMPFRAGKPTGRPIPRRLIFSLIYNDLRGMGLLVGLIFRRHDMALRFRLHHGTSG